MPFGAQEPPPSAWRLLDPTRSAEGEDLVAIGADLEPGTLLAAYRAGLFPMPLPRAVWDAVRPREPPADAEPPIAWWSPDPRAILPLDAPRVGRSLRAACRRFEIRVDSAFEAVVAACADPARDGAWIDPRIVAAYRRLHHLGWAHSVEAWGLDDGRLAGGLYGVAIGGLFAGESMFHWRTDASKVALAGLAQLLRERGYRLHDVQWATPHLLRLGAVEVPRPVYLSCLRDALQADVDPLGPLPVPLRLA